MTLWNTPTRIRRYLPRLCISLRAIANVEAMLGTGLPRGGSPASCVILQISQCLSVELLIILSAHGVAISPRVHGNKS